MAYYIKANKTKIENGTRQRKMDCALAGALSAILEMPIDTIVQHEKAWLEQANPRSLTSQTE